MNKLAGLEVLVLRAPRTDDPLPARLTDQGAKVHLLPVQKISILSEPRWLAAGSALARPGRGNYHKAIFISARAASLALSSPGITREVLNTVDQFFAIGPTTASVLEARDFAVSYPVNGWNSETLLALPRLQQVGGERIVIFRGKGGREALGRVLCERGATVDYCELYERQTDNSSRGNILALITSGVRVVLIAHSAEVLGDLLVVLGPDYHQQVLDTALVVPGERLAKRARSLGFNQLIVAESALAGALERALVDWYTPG